MVAGFILETAGSLAIMELSDTYAKKAEVPPEAKSSVTIILGGGETTAGGPVPHVALWDDSEHALSDIQYSYCRLY